MAEKSDFRPKPCQLQSGLVDLHAVEALFVGMDADICGQLLDAAEEDASEWTERLVRAWRDDNAEEQVRARHALKGICGNFGMTALLDQCTGDLASATATAAVRDCLDASIAALRGAVARIG